MAVAFMCIYFLIRTAERHVHFLNEVFEGPLDLQFLSYGLHRDHNSKNKARGRIGSNIAVKIKVDTSPLENQISL